MASPFPGMEPYLEQFWGDIHTSLITYVRDQLGEQLPHGLRARAEEHVSLETTDDRKQEYIPVVHIQERPDRVGEDTYDYGSAATVEPVVVDVSEPETQRCIQVVDTTDGNRVVTAVEILSPYNKTAGYDKYLDKQKDIVDGGVNLVEIDLIRQGRHVVRAPISRIPEIHRNSYYVCVSAAEHRTAVKLYPFKLRDVIPAVRIPLRRDDSDIVLHLQPLIERSYRAGRYDDIDYSARPTAALSATEMKWLDERLKEASLR